MGQTPEKKIIFLAESHVGPENKIFALGFPKGFWGNMETGRVGQSSIFFGNEFCMDSFHVLLLKVITFKVFVLLKALLG